MGRLVVNSCSLWAGREETRRGVQWAGGPGCAPAASPLAQLCVDVLVAQEAASLWVVVHSLVLAAACSHFCGDVGPGEQRWRLCAGLALEPVQQRHSERVPRKPGGTAKPATRTSRRLGPPLAWNCGKRERGVVPVVWSLSGPGTAPARRRRGELHARCRLLWCWRRRSCRCHLAAHRSFHEELGNGEACVVCVGSLPCHGSPGNPSGAWAAGTAQCLGVSPAGLKRWQATSLRKQRGAAQSQCLWDSCKITPKQRKSCVLSGMPRFWGTGSGVCLPCGRLRLGGACSHHAAALPVAVRQQTIKYRSMLAVRGSTTGVT